MLPIVRLRLDDIDFRDNSYDVLSVDIFDTLLTRLVAQPSHIFALLEKELIETHGAQFQGFSRVRLFAERRARSSKRVSDLYADVNLENIYLEIRRELSLGFGKSMQIAQREMEIERDCAQMVPHAFEMVTRARAAGVRVIAVSDNYMSSTQLLSMFEAAGITGFMAADIFVSSEQGGTKANGRIWDVVVEAMGVSSDRIIHVGDHDEADGESARTYGLHAVVDSRMNRSHRFPINTTPSVLTHSRLEATVRDELRELAWDPALVMGSTTAALIVAAQIKMLDEALQRDRSSQVYFAARDGYLGHTLWNTVRVPEGAPQAQYLHVSRSVLWRTSRNFKPNRLVGPRESLTLARLAHRLEMPELVSMVQGVDADTLLSAELAWRIIEQHRKAIDQVTAQHRDLVIEYLRAKGIMNPGRHVVVDLGWTGSSLADLAALVHEESCGKASVEGLFLGLYWDATHIRTRFAMHTFATNDMATGDQQRALLASHAVIEALITAPHGSVVGFRRDQHGVEPVLAEQRVEQEEYARVIGQVCAHAARTAQQLVCGTHPSGVTLDDVTGDGVWASIMQTIHTPRPDEIDLFGSIRLVIAIDHADDGIYLVPRRWPQGSIVDVHDTLLRGHWLRGSVASSQFRHKYSHDIQSMISVWPEVGPDWVTLTTPR